MGFLLGWDGVPSICWEVLGVHGAGTPPPPPTLASDQNRSYHFGPKCD